MVMVIPISVSLVLLAVLLLSQTHLGSDLQYVDKPTVAEKTVSRQSQDFVQKAAESSATYDLKLVMLGVRRASWTEIPEKDLIAVTNETISSNPKLKFAMVRYDEDYLKWASDCEVVGLGECEEINMRQPDSYYVQLTAEEYGRLTLTLKPREVKEGLIFPIKPWPSKEILSYPVGTIGRLSGRWITSNSTNYWISFYTISTNPRTQTKLFNFDQDKVGAPPSYLGAERTISINEWSVMHDVTATSGPSVLSRTPSNTTDVHQPYILLRGETYANVSVSVNLKIVSGVKEGSAGIIFRFVDSENHYLLKANALENSLTLFKYTKGQLFSLAKSPAAIPSGRWHSLRVIAIGNSIQSLINGKLIIYLSDSTFREGLVGLSTGVDSKVSLDDFIIES